MAAAYSTFVQAGIQHIFWFSITDQPDGSFGLRDRPVEAALRAFALGQAGGGDARRGAAGGVVTPERTPLRA